MKQCTECGSAEQQAVAVRSSTCCCSGKHRNDPQFYHSPLAIAASSQINEADGPMLLAGSADGAVRVWRSYMLPGTALACLHHPARAAAVCRLHIYYGVWNGYWVGMTSVLLTPCDIPLCRESADGDCAPSRDHPPATPDGAHHCICMVSVSFMCSWYWVCAGCRYLQLTDPSTS